MLHQKTKNPKGKFNLSPGLSPNIDKISRNLSTPFTGKKKLAPLFQKKKKKFARYSNFQYTIFQMPQ